MFHPKFLSAIFYLVTGFMNSNPILWLLLTFAYVPFGLYLLTLDFTSRAFSSPFVMAACFFVVLNITRILHYVNLFFYFFLFSLYISHNCLFYYIFFVFFFFLKKNVLSHALFLYLCRHSQIISLKQIHSQRP